MKYRIKVFVVLTLALFCLGVVGGCAAPTVSAPVKTTLTVFAASSLTSAFAEMGMAFESHHPEVKVTFNYAGSQDLRTQLEQGAHADVFASADTKNMDPLTANNALQSEPRVFARNRLVVIIPQSNPAGIKELKDLARPGLKLDVADESVPVGNYTLQVLDKLSADAAYGADFKTKVLARVMSKENNVKQVVSKVSLGEADAGIVYTTDAQAAASKLTTLEIPDPLNVVATYPIAVLKSSANAPLAQQFIDLVLSSDGQAILRKYGFAGL